MKYFSPAEVFFAVTAFALYGALCGALYPVLSRIGAMLRALLCLPTDALALARAPARRKADGCARRRMRPYGGAGKHLGDFFFFLAVGIGLLLLTYVTLDGMYRLYTLLAFAVMLLVCRYTLGQYLPSFLDRICLVMYREVLLFLGVLFYPLMALARLAYRRLLMPPLSFVCRRVLLVRSHRLCAKKLDRTRASFIKRTKFTNKKSTSPDPLANFMQTDKNALNESIFLDKNNKK